MFDVHNHVHDDNDDAHDGAHGDGAHDGGDVDMRAHDSQYGMDHNAYHDIQENMGLAFAHLLSHFVFCIAYVNIKNMKPYMIKIGKCLNFSKKKTPLWTSKITIFPSPEKHFFYYTT